MLLCLTNHELYGNIEKKIEKTVLELCFGA